MSGHALAHALLARPDRPVVVAGHGALAFVTHAGTDTGQRVTVLYVEDPPAPTPDAGGENLGDQGQRR